MGRLGGIRTAIGLVAVGVGMMLFAGAGTASAAPVSSSLAALTAGQAPTAPGFHTHRGATGEVDTNVCSYDVPAGYAHCNARVRIDSRARSERPAKHTTGSTTIGNNGAYDPSYLQSAYNVESAAAAHGGGAGQIVAIVDAYDDPNVASDLSYYRSFFGLPVCPRGTVSASATGCVFEKVNQNGSTRAAALPAPDPNWSVEISLDVEMVSATCPKCQILLVEANSAYLSDLGTAANEAVALKANAVSNSYGSGEYFGETADAASYYDHPGVAVTVSSGDNGYGVEFPAASPYVTAIGGTSLTQLTNTGTRNGSETAWAGAGAGCSAYEPKPTWQTDTGCTNRTVADVSAVADPNTGVWVYDTYQTSGWAIYGGTSVASPIIASFYALAGNAAGSSAIPASYAYANPSALYDVTSGNDGGCTPSNYLCNAVPGYDGPTGLGTPGGSPNSMAAFVAPPTVPGAPNLTASTSPTGGVRLAWSAPPNGGSTILSYELYRSTSSGGEVAYVKVSCTASPCTYNDSNTTRRRIYYYEVAAVNAIGQSPLSNEASAAAR